MKPALGAASPQLPLAIDDRSSLPSGRVRGRGRSLSGLGLSLVVTKNTIVICVVCFFSSFFCNVDELGCDLLEVLTCAHLLLVL